MQGDTILYLRRADSTWVSETAVVTPESYYYFCGPLTYTVKGEPCVVISGYNYSYTYYFIDLYIKQADTWRAYGAVSGGRRSTFDYIGCAPDTGGGAVILYTYSDEFQPTVFRLSRYGTVDSGASAGAAAVHNSGVPHVAYIRNQLRYACRVGTTWYRDTISAASSLQLAGIVLEDSLPTIGFIDPATGVLLARRQPVGIQEHQQCPLARSEPTILRDVLFLPKASNPRAQAASLLDISGRNVLDLKPGANDVRALAPGVYFVEEGLGRTRKVVLTGRR
jgi:hypothetical protein